MGSGGVVVVRFFPHNLCGGLFTQFVQFATTEGTLLYLIFFMTFPKCMAHSDLLTNTD